MMPLLGHAAPAHRCQEYRPFMQAVEFGLRILLAIALAAFGWHATAADNPTPDCPGDACVAPTEHPTPNCRGDACVARTERLDWVSIEAMSPEQRAELAPACCGAFIDISRTEGSSPDSTKTSFTSAEGFTQTGPDTVSIDGEVIVRQGSRNIANDGATVIDNAAGTFELEGDVKFREPGILLRGTSAFIDNESNVNRVRAARYVLHETGIHGSADAIVYDSESGRITMDNGEFSRCEPANPFWTIAADEMTLDPERGRGTARDLRLRLGDVTVFRYPANMSFPLGDQRVSGFLPPSTGSTRSGGFDFELPYYLNLAPHYDATIMPRLISDRGAMLSTEFRYLADWSMNTVNLSWLGDDKLFEPNLAGTPGSGSPPTENRWFTGFQHNGSLGNGWRTLVDFSAVSDRDWFVDLAGSGLNVTTQNHLNRQARLSYQSSALQADLDVQRIQIIDPLVDALNIAKPYDRLPHFRFRTGFDLGANFRLGLAGQMANFDRKLDENLLSRRHIDNGALTTGRRVNLSPRLDWSAQTQGAFLRMAATYDHVGYQLDRQAIGSPADPDLGTAAYSLDSGLIFERGRGQGGMQTLEPRLFYLNRQYRDQSLLPLFDTAELNFGFRQLFRERRFSGGDRFADADQLGIAITSRLLDRAGRERGRFSLGQIHYFRDRLVSLADPLRQWQPLYSPVGDTSALAGELEIHAGQNWRISADVQWNEHYREVDEGSLQLRYQRDRERLFNFSWRYRSLLQATPYLLSAGIDPNINQTDVSGAWPLSANWKLLARWNYDHSNSRNLETFAGVEYRNCCATIRVVAREWLDEYELFVPNVPSNRGVFVQVSLHGLGNLAGGGLSNLLRDGIQGFRDPDYE